ncbi:MAG TPA: alpha/beta fold hydrolase [Thermoanaerobaculia bacterium]|nr:alpha/beta fold hydrolase [Thermoanaerobaculia bacterium]
MAARHGKSTKRKGTPSPRLPAEISSAGSGSESDLGYGEYRLSEQEVEQALRTGERSGLLEDYFGAEAYAELVQLARQVPGARVRGGQKVWILPGIMGSTLSKGSDLYWFDPLEIWRGGLAELALVPGMPAFRASGVILMTYLKLKLTLQLSGLEASFQPFDWRRSIDDLGRELAAKLAAEGSGKVHLVAHSMGGLVARSAIGHGATFRRLIQVGTPNFGSFVPALSFRGVGSVVKTLGLLDRKHDVEWLVRNVFTTLPGLTQMLPVPEKFSAIDLYDVDQWPRDGLSPQPELLAQARQVQSRLPHSRQQLAHCFLIAGVNQDTVTDLARADGEWVFERTTDGDGTVPLEMCRMPELEERSYFVEEEHGALPNNSAVAAAVCDLVDQGSTSRLPTEPPRARSPRRETVPEHRLRESEAARGAAVELSRREVREALAEFVAPGGAPAAPTITLPGRRPPQDEAAGGMRHQLQQVVVGRRRQHRLDLRLALGSITEAPTRALALGIFKDVAPSGAALALDGRMKGAITEITQRRMFTGNLGEVFVLPTGRHALAADLVAFVGLGSFDRFGPDALQIAAENVLRTFITTAVEEFSTVVIGGGSGESADAALRNMLGGFVRALLDADRDHHFRRVVICERDPERFLAVKEELYRLASTPLCEDLELTFDETELLSSEAPRQAGPARRGEDPVYLLVRQEGDQDQDEEVTLQSSVLTAEGKAALLTRRQPVSSKELKKVLQRLTAKKPSFERDGPALGRLILEPAVRTVLATQKKRHLVVVHDALTSRIPWETLALAEGDALWFPAAAKGLTRRYEAENLVVAKWLKERVTKETLEVLLVVNPTGDLGGAEDEGERVQELFADKGGVRLTMLLREQATRKALLEAFGSGRYDVLHYAGHAFFNPAGPAGSGLLAAGEEVVSGADLAGVANLPSLVFFNACESGRVRGKRGEPSMLEAPLRPVVTREAHQAEAVGLAEAMMRGGVANLIGTYWPVSDAGAVAFADAFYTAVLSGRNLREAVQSGRGALLAPQPPLADWANYLFYGNPDFVLKLR